MNIDHIGIVVHNLDEAVNTYKNLLGVTDTSVDKVEYAELPERKLKIAQIKLKDILFEFLQPISQESLIFKFLEKRGQGIHHLAFSVNNLEEELKNLEARGFKIIEPRISKGLEQKEIAFLYPENTCGVLIELVNSGVWGQARK